MRVEYEPIIDAIHRVIERAQAQDKNINRIVLTPTEYGQLRDEWNANGGGVPRLPDSYKEFNKNISTLFGVSIAVDGADEILKIDQKFNSDVGF